jgi:hypothetical protein
MAKRGLPYIRMSSKRENQIGLFKIILTLFMVGLLWLINRNSPPTSELVVKGALPLNFKGKIVAMYREKYSHNELRAKLSDGYVYGIYADWENKLSMGDSISKKKGNVFVEVFKANGHKDTLDYKKMVKNWPK